MTPTLAREIAEAVGAPWPEALAAAIVTGVTSDSRSVEPGDLFVALRGTRADGRTFIPAALEAGAVAVLAEKNGPYPERVLAVEDPLAALTSVARLVRRRFAGPVIGVAGSAGKTTTKEMLQTLLSARFRSVASERSFNNHLGVPLTICRVEADTDVLVAELGTNHPGELAPLCELARPTVAVLTSIGAEHLEGFLDLAGVLEEELAIVRALPPGGIVFINADNPWLADANYPSHVRVVRCGFGPRATDVRGEVVPSAGAVAIRLSAGGPVIGTQLAFGVLRHALLLASAIARHLGIDESVIAAAAAAIRPAALRGEVRQVGDATVLVDCYNSNPLSAAAAMEEMKVRPGRKSAILGDMLELGAAASESHAELGRLCAQSGITNVLFIGMHGADFARGFGGKGHLTWRRTTGESHDDAARLLDAGGLVLMKGSRGIGLERLLAMEVAHG